MKSFFYLCFIWTGTDFESKKGSGLVVERSKNVKAHESPFLDQRSLRTTLESMCWFCLLIHNWVLLQPPLFIFPQRNLIMVTGNAVQQLSSFSDWVLPFTKSFDLVGCICVVLKLEVSGGDRQDCLSLVLQKQRLLIPWWDSSKLSVLCQALVPNFFLLKILAHLLLYVQVNLGCW